MVQDQRLVLPIAPADHGGALAKSLASPTPVSPEEAAPIRKRPQGLTMSKQWVLPPRPKPGRKPKPKPPKPARDAQKPDSVSAGADAVRRPDARPGHPHSLAANARRSSGPGDGSGGARDARDARAAPDPRDQSDEDCSLCSRDDCMCETIGLKPSPPGPAAPEPRKSLPTLDMILNGPPIKMDAVPLKRSASDRGGGGGGGGGLDRIGKSFEVAPKFPRTDMFQPMHPKHVLSVPSPLESLPVGPDGCGFCTENTPCACAEAAASEQAPTPPSAAQSPLSGSSISLPAPAPPHGGAYMSSPQTLSPAPESACASCSRDAMTMLFCLSLAASRPLPLGSVSIPCHLAFKTLQKHPRFDGCDLGKLIRRLEVSSSRQVGVQSINRVLQDLERGEFVTS